MLKKEWLSFLLCHSFSVLFNRSLADFFTEFYMKPYTRMGPYVIGMLAGYFLHVKQCKLNIKWVGIIIVTLT